MTKLYLPIISLILLTTRVGAAYYNCSFGPDALGNYVEEVVESATAHRCGEFCSCVGLTNNTCHFGPDDKGNFVTRIVPSELADKCDRSFCVCDTHYFDPESEETFEKVLEERHEAAIDWTVKDHGQNIAREAKPVYIEKAGQLDNNAVRWCGFACA